MKEADGVNAISSRREYLSLVIEDVVVIVLKGLEKR
jgi:hypothetical protein